MALKRIGTNTIKFSNPPVLISAYSTVGVKEGQGPLRDWFDEVLSDDKYGEKTWEKSEGKILKNSIMKSLESKSIKTSEVEFLIGGDLINQDMISSYIARDLEIPFLGIYGACSNMTESSILAGMIIDGGYADLIVAATSSHFSTAERQYRFPLEHGNQRSKTSQWTVTGSGAFVFSNKGKGPRAICATVGKVVDFGIKDVNNMGAAMAPAAVDTIFLHLKDTGTKPEDYDLIVTGDLGKVGKEIAKELLEEKGYKVDNIYDDCGDMIFDAETQDTNSGGSGCGCSASVFSGYVYKKMLRKDFKKVLLVSTGALLSTISTQQGESIPGIAHAITFSI